MSARISWAAGGKARLVSLSVDSITVRSSVPWPPGSRVDGRADDEKAKLRIKVHACRRQPDGEFLIEGRPLDLSRVDRERLAASIAP